MQVLPSSLEFGPATPLLKLDSCLQKLSHVSKVLIFISRSEYVTGKLFRSEYDWYFTDDNWIFLVRSEFQKVLLY